MRFPLLHSYGLTFRFVFLQNLPCPKPQGGLSLSETKLDRDCMLSISSFNVGNDLLMFPAFTLVRMQNLF